MYIYKREVRFYTEETVYMQKRPRYIYKRDLNMAVCKRDPCIYTKEKYVFIQKRKDLCICKRQQGIIKFQKRAEYCNVQKRPIYMQKRPMYIYKRLRQRAARIHTKETELYTKETYTYEKET